MRPLLILVIILAVVYALGSIYAVGSLLIDRPWRSKAHREGHWQYSWWGVPICLLVIAVLWPLD